MQSNRRNWIKQLGLAAAGMGLGRVTALAEPSDLFTEAQEAGLPIKLSSNENPYGPSPLARRAMAEKINVSNRYDWDITTRLIETLSVKNNVRKDNILMAAGSTEVLDLVLKYAANQQGNFVLAYPTYSYWSDTIIRSGLERKIVPLTKEKQVDLPAMLKAINAETRFVYICNPNNPTGTVCERNELLRFVNEASKQTLVIVDEAYIDFTTETSLVSEAVQNKNLVVVRTFSKIYGLAGARVGYMVAHSRTMEKVAAMQSWNNGSITVVSAAAAMASLSDTKFVSDTYKLNEKARQYTMDQLKQLNITCIPSSTNFVYFSLDKYKYDYFRRLKDNHISGTGIYEDEGSWTRITIGTLPEMQKFIAAIR